VRLKGLGMRLRLNAPFAAHGRAETSVELEDSELVRRSDVPLVTSRQVGVCEDLRASESSE
jgi:hypothetical protein